MEKRQETHFLGNEDKEIWIEDYVERDTTAARKRGEDAETAIKQEQEDMTKAENEGLKTGEPNNVFPEMLNEIGDNLHDLASSDDVEAAEDEQYQDTELGKLCEDDEPGWVMGTIPKTVQQRMGRLWPK